MEIPKKDKTFMDVFLGLEVGYNEDRTKQATLNAFLGTQALLLHVEYLDRDYSSVNQRFGSVGRITFNPRTHSSLIKDVQFIFEKYILLNIHILVYIK